MSAEDPFEASFKSAAAHEVEIKLEPVRIRVLDRFGAPCANMDCEIETPLLGTRTKKTDGKGWLDIRCPKGTAHVDLTILDADEDAERRVWLAPLPDDDGDETKRRLRNLGYGLPDADDEDDEEDAEGGGDAGAQAGGADSDGDDEVRRALLRDFGVDTEDEDLASHLKRIEDLLKKEDAPHEIDKNVLEDKGANTSDPGERT